MIDGIDDSSNLRSQGNDLDRDFLVVDEAMIKRDGIGDIETVKDLGRGKPVIGRIGKNRMSDSHDDSLGTIVLQGIGSGNGTSCRIHHIVDDEAIMILDITDDVHDFRLILVVSSLVDDGKRSIELFGNLSGTVDTAMVRRDDDCVGLVDERIVVKDMSEKRNGRKVILNAGEEALFLGSMQIEGDDSVSTCSGKKVGDQLGRDRFTGFGLAILSCISEIRNDDIDFSTGCSS